MFAPFYFFLNFFLNFFLKPSLGGLPFCSTGYLCICSLCDALIGIYSWVCVFYMILGSTLYHSNNQWSSPAFLSCSMPIFFLYSFYFLRTSNNYILFFHPQLHLWFNLKSTAKYIKWGGQSLCQRDPGHPLGYIMTLHLWSMTSVISWLDEACSPGESDLVISRLDKAPLTCGVWPPHHPRLDEARSPVEGNVRHLWVRWNLLTCGVSLRFLAQSDFALIHVLLSITISFYLCRLDLSIVTIVEIKHINIVTIVEIKHF